MTGAHGRPEVIIEGSYDAEGPWIPFHFYAKPGRLDEMPRFISLFLKFQDFLRKEFYKSILKVKN